MASINNKIYNRFSSFVRQENATLGECESFDEQYEQELGECTQPYADALDNLVNNAANSDEIRDVIFSDTRRDGEFFKAIKNVTNETFFCDTDFLDAFPLAFSCEATLCNFSCDDLSDAQIDIASGNLESILAELKICEVEAFEYCDLIGPGHKSGYGLSMVFMLLSWGLKQMH